MELAAAAAAGAGKDAAGDTRQIVTFRIGDEYYGLDIRAVREIRAWTAATTLPNTPEFVRGVVNLRGMIVPILDLRARFGRGMTEPTRTHVVIVVSVDTQLVGFLVDAVSDIVTISADGIMPLPSIDGSDAGECLDGIITIGEQMVALIAGERVAAPATLH